MKKERRTHGEGYSLVLQADHPRADPKGYVLEHILVAEKVIGRFLPISTPIHHVDGRKTHNVNNNLVICDSNSYHILLDARTKAFIEAGDAHKRKCTICHQYDLPSNLITNCSRAVYHRSCRDAYKRKRRLLREPA